MLLASVLLVILPLIEEPVDSAAAFGIILLGVPIYFIFIFPHKHRPTIFFKANGMYVCIYVCILDAHICKYDYHMDTYE